MASLALLQEVTFYIEGGAEPHILHWKNDIGNKDAAEIRPEISRGNTGHRKHVRKRMSEKSARLIEITLQGGDIGPPSSNDLGR